MTLPTPEDHVAITQLLARYCLALDHDDLDAWVDLFTPDAVYAVYGREYVGHDGLRKLMTGGVASSPQRPRRRCPRSASLLHRQAS